MYIPYYLSVNTSIRQVCLLVRAAVFDIRYPFRRPIYNCLVQVGHIIRYVHLLEEGYTLHCVAAGYCYYFFDISRY